MKYRDVFGVLIKNWHLKRREAHGPIREVKGSNEISRFSGRQGSLLESLQRYRQVDSSVTVACQIWK